MGSFSRRCSKLINSCEYLWTVDCVSAWPEPERVSWPSAVGLGRLWGEMPGEPRGLVSLCFRASTPRLPDSLPLPHRFTPVAQLLYQEYSDVFLNKEIQSQQRLDSLTEAPGPMSPRQPRKALVSSESYLRRLSMASSGSLWQEIPVVRNSTVLLSMTHEDQKLQEVPPGRAGAGAAEGQAGSPLFTSAPSAHRHHRSRHPHARAVPTTLTTRRRVIPSLLGSNCFVNITTLPPSTSFSLHRPFTAPYYWFELIQIDRAPEFDGRSICSI